MDLAAYLASSDSDSDSPTTTAKYRALLSGASMGIKKDTSTTTGDMEVTFTSGLSEKDKDTPVIQDDDDIPETTIEKYTRKERERKQRRKEKSRLLKGPAEPESESVQEPTPAATDLGFNDPFFADATPTSISAAQTKKEKKAAAAALRAAEEAAAASKRAELELLMADDNDDGLRHFDMKQVIRAEKGVKKHRGKKRPRAQEDVQEGFEIDVKDPRFAAVYERHEFAIDPTNPRFVKTGAMGKILEERRRRTRVQGEGEGEGEGRKRRKGGGKEEVGRLVEAIKKRAGKK